MNAIIKTIGRPFRAIKQSWAQARAEWREIDIETLPSLREHGNWRFWIKFGFIVEYLAVLVIYASVYFLLSVAGVVAIWALLFLLGILD